MKKIITGIALLCASSATMADAPGGPGCGWGNLLFEGQNGLGPHFLATTTNGTSGNKTFGMTTGTNGCSTDGSLTYGGKSMISSIMDEFTEDVARGQGEALNAVAVLYGIEREDREAFSQTLHANFDVIFPTENVTAAQVNASIDEILRKDTRLSKYVA